MVFLKRPLFYGFASFISPFVLAMPEFCNNRVILTANYVMISKPIFLQVSPTDMLTPDCPAYFSSVFNIGMPDMLTPDCPAYFSSVFNIGMPDMLTPDCPAYFSSVFNIGTPDMLTPDVRCIYRLFLDARQLRRTVRHVSAGSFTLPHHSRNLETQIVWNEAYFMKKIKSIYLFSLTLIQRIYNTI